MQSTATAPLPPRGARAPGRRCKTGARLAGRTLLLCAAALLLLLLVRPAAAYSVADCNVTVTSADTGVGGFSWVTNVIFIDSDATLAALRDSVDGCAATGGAGGGGGWRIVGGGLYIWGADDVVDLEALKDLRAIEGKSSEGYSLYIRSNAKLASLSGLRNVRGVLPGKMGIMHNDALASLSGLEGITVVGGALSSTYSHLLQVENNGALCLSADRARLTSCTGPGTCSASTCTNQGGCDGTALAHPAGGIVSVSVQAH